MKNNLSYLWPIYASIVILTTSYDGFRHYFANELISHVAGLHFLAFRGTIEYSDQGPRAIMKCHMEKLKLASLDLGPQFIDKIQGNHGLKLKYDNFLKFGANQYNEKQKEFIQERICKRSVLFQWKDCVNPTAIEILYFGKGGNLEERKSFECQKTEPH